MKKMENKKVPQSQSLALSVKGRKGTSGVYLNSSPILGEVGRGNGLTKRGNGRRAFTLVELIIVITILAILATIAFVSFQGYSSQSRDSNRVATVKNIENGVNIYYTKTGKVPSPENITGTGTVGGVPLGYVGTIGEGIARQINMNAIPKDPQANTQYMYGVDSSNRYYQVGLTLESTTASIPGISPLYAENGVQAKVSGNYIYPLKSGNKLYSLPSFLYTATGVLDSNTKFIIDGGTNLPYQVGTQAGSGQSVAEVLKIIAGTGGLSLTGVDLPNPLMTSAQFKADTTVPYPQAFSGVALAMGIGDKTKLGVAVYGGKYVGDGRVSAGGGNQDPTNATTWQSKDSNCTIATDVTVTGTNLSGSTITQVWAPCNSTLGTGIEYNASNYCRNYQGSNIGGTSCYGYNTLESSYNSTYGVNNIWGKLYTWADSPSACPTGRHVPSQGEWTILLKNLGCSGYGDENTTGRQCDGLGWSDHASKNDTNNIVNRLKIPLAGYRDTDGSIFHHRGNYTYFWSSSEYDSSNARGVALYRNNSAVNRNIRDKAYGFSVRCLKD